MFKLIDKFNLWVANTLPGWKIRITTALGSLGMLAATMQDYLTGLPLDQFVTSKTIALVSGGLFTLSYWFRSLTDKTTA